MNATQTEATTPSHAATAAAGQDKLRAIISRSRVDAAFRARLIESPVATLVECVGAPIPTGVTVTIVDATAERTIQLPPFAGALAGLSDDELEQVAGGSPDVGEMVKAGVSAAYVYVTTGIEATAECTLMAMKWLCSS